MYNKEEIKQQRKNLKKENSENKKFKSFVTEMKWIIKTEDSKKEKSKSCKNQIFEDSSKESKKRFL